jgi:hypothetical protein
MKPTNLPVLLITFNRPDVTSVVLDRILEMNPPKIYFFNDAPRPGNSRDEEKCREIRQMASELQGRYSGEVLTRFEPSNLGCKMGESTAMSWLFEHEEKGIVLEDDILPSPEFFYFCEEMLARYADDNRIFSVTGCNLLNQWHADEKDYFFSLFGSFWGWAGWRRAWKHYDVKMEAWQDAEVRRLVQNYLPFPEYKELRRKEFEALMTGKANTWDFQFCLAHYINHAMAIVPSKNMVINIGIQHADAVHMVSDSPFSDLRHQQVSFPLRSNTIMIPDYEYELGVVQKAYPFLFDVPQSPPAPVPPGIIQRIKNKIR